MNACTFFVFCSYYLEVLHQNYGGPASLNVAVFQGESSFTEDQTDDAVNEIQVLVADYEVFNEEQVRSGSAVAILLLCTVHLVPDCSPPLSGVDSHFWRYSLLLAFLYAKYEGTAKSQLAWLSTKPWNGEQASRLYRGEVLALRCSPWDSILENKCTVVDEERQIHFLFLLNCAQL